MKYAFYTTSKSSWYAEKLRLVFDDLERTKGREPIEFDVFEKRPEQPDIIKDKDGDYRISWDWFETHFDTDYDGVIFHFTPYYRRKWGIDSHLNGSRNSRSKRKPMYWVCCEKGVAEGYEGVMLYRNGQNKMGDLTDFERINYHEHAHYDEDVDDNDGNLLTDSSVHDFDYRLKRIHQYHLLVDYRGQSLRHRFDRLMSDIIRVVKKYI